MKSLVFTLFFVAFMGLPTMAEAGLLKCSEEQTGQVSNKTKLLKTYTKEYWQIATNEVKSLPAGVLKTGLVVGDLHFNNAGIYYDYVRNRAEFQIIDFDDAGKNYLIVDFFKFLTYVHKLDKTVDQRAIFNSYVAGLNKIESNPPAEIESLLYRSQLDFNKDSRKYVENQREEITAFDKATIKKPVLEIVTKLKQLKAISRLLDLDYMVQVNDSGSSMNALRIQFIGTDSKGVTGVIEFKQMKCSATGDANYQDVMAAFDHIKKVAVEFNPSNAVASQFVYKYDEQNYFLVREKKKNFLKKINLESLPTDRIAAVASFYANYLGRVHAISADSKYNETVKANSAELIAKAKAIAKIFKDEVKP